MKDLNKNFIAFIVIFSVKMINFFTESIDKYSSNSDQELDIVFQN